MSAITAEVRSARQLMKKEGIKALFRKYGWKLVAVVFGYYLIRDLTIYVLLPLMLVRLLK